MHPLKPDASEKVKTFVPATNTIKYIHALEDNSLERAENSQEFSCPGIVAPLKTESAVNLRRSATCEITLDIHGFKHKVKTDRTEQNRGTQNAMDTNQQHTKITTTQNQYGKPSFFATHRASS
jgi:hypothetical protein